MPSVAVKGLYNNTFSTPTTCVHTHTHTQADPYSLDALIEMNGRSKAGLDIYITVSLLCLINHREDKQKGRIIKEMEKGDTIEKNALLDKQRVRWTMSVCETGQRRKRVETSKRREMSIEREDWKKEM